MATTIDMHNLVSSEEAINLIETSVKTLINNPSLADSLPPILLRGAPGVGKSTIVKNIAKKLNIGFVDVRLAEMERVDFAGLPSVADGTTNWNVPSFWPRDPESKGIILLDEITSAPADVQVAAYQIVLDRKISNSEYKLPNGWFIVAAGNRTVDRAVVKTMSSALANRFMHFEVAANIEDWILWAVANGIHPSVTGYLRYRPESLFKMDAQNLEMGWPSPRSWERVSNVIPLFTSNEDVLRKAVYGLVGNNVGVEFMEFHRINEQFDDVLEMLTNPKAEVKIPKEIDRKYALCSAVSYLLWNGKTEKDDKIRVEGLYRIVNELSADFATALVKSAMVGNPRVSRIQAAAKIMGSKSYPAFAKKYASAMKTVEVKL